MKVANILVLMANILEHFRETFAIAQFSCSSMTPANYAPALTDPSQAKTKDAIGF
jgi:hypothetical protein